MSYWDDDIEKQNRELLQRRFVRDKVVDKLDCSHCFNELWFCATPVNQFQQLYRYGAFNNCKEAFKNWRTCVSAKLKDEDVAKGMIKETRMNPHRVPASVGVWELRENPSWDGEEG